MGLNLKRVCHVVTTLHQDAPTVHVKRVRAAIRAVQVILSTSLTASAHSLTVSKSSSPVNHILSIP